MVMRFSMVRVGAIALIALFLPGTVHAMHYGPPQVRVAQPPMMSPSPMLAPTTPNPAQRFMVAPVTAGPRPQVSLPPGYALPVCPPPVCAPPPCEKRGALSALVSLVTVPLKMLGNQVRSLTCQTASVAPPTGCVPMMPPGLTPPPPLPRRATKCAPVHAPGPVYGGCFPMRP